MKMKRFEKLGVSSSILGFGCMRLPMNKDGTIDKEASQAMVDYAYEHGVTYFDTAWGYHSEKSELFVGEALKKYPRESVQIATKSPVWLIEKEGDFEDLFQQQLDKLQTDYVDFYLFHALSKDRFETVKKFDLYNRARQLQKEGKIKYLGFSYHDINENFDEIIDAYDWDFCQIQYNYIDVELMNANYLYNKLEESGIPAVIMEPVRGGFLAGLPEDITAPFAEYDKTKSMASWAMRWVAEKENVHVILSGMSDMEQMMDNVAVLSGDYSLSDEEHKVIDQVVKNITAVETVPCTGCKYCMPCPFGVNIPDNFRVYNNLKLFQNPGRTVREYNMLLTPESLAGQCQKCGACEPMCPQQIHIIEMLEKADELITKELGSK